MLVFMSPSSVCCSQDSIHGKGNLESAYIIFFIYIKKFSFNVVILFLKSAGECLMLIKASFI